MKPAELVSSRGEQLVSDSRLSHHEAGIGRVSLQLFPQMYHIDTEVMSVFDAIWAPDLFENVAVRQDLAGVPDEQAQQSILRGRQFYLPATERDHPRGHIHDQIAGAEHELSPPGAAWRWAERSLANSSPVPKGLVT